MRENRTSGSEGRESETNRTSLPLSSPSAYERKSTVQLGLNAHDEASCRFATQPFWLCHPAGPFGTRLPIRWIFRVEDSVTAAYPH